MGSPDAPWLEAGDKALARIQEFAPTALVVALGLDASESDPLQGLKVTGAGFHAMAGKIARSACRRCSSRRAAISATISAATWCSSSPASRRFRAWQSRTALEDRTWRAPVADLIVETLSAPA